MQIKEITKFLEHWAPSSYQEDYDNARLIIGSPNQVVNQALITLDVTEEVIDEAIRTNSQLIIAHHPLIFKGIKKINDRHWIDKCVVKAIKNDIAIYAIHTNLDNVITGVNRKISDKIGLENCQILQPKLGKLQKITTFVPSTHKESVVLAMHEAGARNIGNYEKCSFQSEGTGFFQPNESANPTVGTTNELASVEETKIEVICPKYLTNAVLNALKNAHPYEEVAYYLHDLQNKNQEVGSGMIGKLANPMEAKKFLAHLKKEMNLSVIKHTKLVKDKIQTVALCGGAGFFLLNTAKARKADIFISADFKYHDYFEANDEIIIADIGHYESEIFTKELIADKIRENFSKFAVRLSEVDTNPINYL